MALCEHLVLVEGPPIALNLAYTAVRRGQSQRIRWTNTTPPTCQHQVPAVVMALNQWTGGDGLRVADLRRDGVHENPLLKEHRAQNRSAHEGGTYSTPVRPPSLVGRRDSILVMTAESVNVRQGRATLHQVRSATRH